MWRPALPFPVAWLAPIAVVLVALLVRLRGLADMPLWYDEIVTLNRAGLPFRALVGDAFANMHYPTYFLLAKPVIGFGAEAARVLSAVFSALTAGAVALITRRLTGCGWTAAAAGLLLALAPFQVLYGQEARAYALLTLAITVALTGLLRLAAAECPATDRTGLLLWTGGSAIAACTMSLGASWLLVSMLVFPFLILRTPAADRVELMQRGAAALVIVLACWAPLLAGVLDPVGTTVSNGTWVPPTNLKGVRTGLSSVFLFRLSEPIAFEPVSMGLQAFGVAVLAAAFVGVWRLRRRLTILITLVLSAVALPVLLLAVSAVSPVFIPRYLIWVAVPFAVLAAVGFGAVGRRYRPAAAAAILIAGLWNLEPYYRADLKPDWPGALYAVWDEAAEGDALYLISPLEQFAAQILENKARPWQLPVPRLTSDREVLSRLLAGATVWMIDTYSRKHGADETKVSPARFAPLGRVEAERTFGQRVTLYRIVPAPQDG
ncbi:MAG: hypothetical protein VW268_13090 [Rhodospirillaceae bacterium]